jgi:hypothetical protein
LAHATPLQLPTLAGQLYDLLSASPFIHAGIDARAVLKTGLASPLFSFTINFVFNFQQINYQHLTGATLDSSPIADNQRVYYSSRYF